VLLSADITSRLVIEDRQERRFVNLNILNARRRLLSARL
jgi:hypothetical protein